MSRLQDGPDNILKKKILGSFPDKVLGPLPFDCQFVFYV